jgi:hypothetical protein
MIIGGECATVQNPFLRYTKEAGWTVLSRIRFYYGATWNLSRKGLFN